jgi:hypothetical protein
MLKLLEASCVGKAVTCESVPITDATILSEGNGSSTGLMLLQQDKSYYVTSSAADLKTVIQAIIDILTQIQALTVTCAAPGAPSTVPVNTAMFAAISTQLTTLKAALK